MAGKLYKVEILPQLPEAGEVGTLYLIGESSYSAYISDGVSFKPFTSSSVTYTLSMRENAITLNGSDGSSNSVTLSAVAVSGDYDDLNNTPTIPDVSVKVDKNGDTMTGNLNINSNVVDVTQSDNGVSSTTYVGSYYRDANNKNVGKSAVNVYDGGTVGLEIYGANVNSSGTTVYNALNLRVDKSGARSVTVSDPSPWRSALGVGIAPTLETGLDGALLPNQDSKMTSLSLSGSDIDHGSIASSTSYVTTASITLSAGLYVLIFGCRFSANANGYRKICISSSSNGAGYGVINTAIGPASPTDITQMQLVTFLRPTASTKYYLNAGQTSGSTLTVTPRYHLLKLA